MSADASEEQIAPRASTRSRVIKLALRASISVGLLTYVLGRADLDAVIAAIAGANGWILFAAFGSQFIGKAITAIRWRGLLRTQHEDVPLGTLICSLIAGCFVRQFLPSTVGGDTVRAYYSARAGVKPSTSIVAVIVDRIIGLLSLIIMGGAALCFSDTLTNWPELKYGFIAAAAAVLLASWVVFVPTPRLIGLVKRIVGRLPARIQEQANRVVDAVTAYQGKTGSLFRSLGWSFLLQLNAMTSYFLIALALGLPVEFDKFFIILPASTIILLLPVSINGIGIREAVFVALLGAHGVEEAGAIAFAFLEYGSVLLTGVVGGFLLLWGRSHQPAAPVHPSVQ